MVVLKSSTEQLRRTGFRLMVNASVITVIAAYIISGSQSYYTILICLVIAGFAVYRAWEYFKSNGGDQPVFEISDEMVRRFHRGVYHDLPLEGVTQWYWDDGNVTIESPAYTNDMFTFSRAVYDNFDEALQFLYHSPAWHDRARHDDAPIPT